MSYQAHTIIKQREYGDPIFSDWQAFCNLTDAMIDLDVDVIQNEARDYFEVSTDELKKYIKQLPNNDEPSACTSEFHASVMTNRELRQALEQSIKETKEGYVAWEWF